MAKRGSGGAWRSVEAAQAMAREALGATWASRLSQAHGIVKARTAIEVRAHFRDPGRVRRLARALRLRCRQTLEVVQELGEAAAGGAGIGWIGDVGALQGLLDHAKELEGLAAKPTRAAAWGGQKASQAALARYVLGRWPKAPRSESAWAYFAIGCGVADPPPDDLAWRALKASWGAALKRVGQATRKTS